jgi:hypothetical protein
MLNQGSVRKSGSDAVENSERLEEIERKLKLPAGTGRQLEEQR